MQGRNRRILTGRLLNATAAIALATGLGGCSIVPDWANPVAWFSSDDAADAAQTPDLASLPDKPAAAQADNQKIADSLTADLQNAKHSAEVLRGGADTPAAPPPETASSKSAAMPPLPAVAAPKPAEDAAPVQKTKKDESFTAAPRGSAIPGTLPDAASDTSDASDAVAPAGAAKPMNYSSSDAISGPKYAVYDGDPVVSSRTLPDPYLRTIELPAGALPVTPADRPDVPAAAAAQTVPSNADVRVESAPAVLSSPAVSSTKTVKRGHPAALVQPASAVAPADATLGFQPSNAPPLDPSITEFVPAEIVQSYEASAVRAGNVSGAVVGSASPRQGVRKAVADGPSYGADSAAGGDAVGVVFFPDNVASLSGMGVAQVRKAAAVYRKDGGAGYVRVIGHASSRTKNMSVDRHLETNLKLSQDRASAVASALERAGVPADKILVEAVSDSQPVYYESMPKGEDGNRRVEIFLQR